MSADPNTNNDAVARQSPTFHLDLVLRLPARHGECRGIVKFDPERRRGKRPRLIHVCVTAGGSNEDEVRKKASSIIGKYVVCIASNGYGDLEGIFETPCLLVESF